MTCDIDDAPIAVSQFWVMGATPLMVIHEPSTILLPGLILHRPWPEGATKVHVVRSASADLG